MTTQTEYQTKEKPFTEVILRARGERFWRDKANERLRGTMRSHEKMANRAQLLEQHPGQRISIDTSLLRDVVDYEAFKCHPDCSVGRDQAIEGSDIDGGIVVTREPVTQEAQQEFVDRLRLMGFSCYSQAEKDGFDGTDPTTLDPEKAELLRKLKEAAKNELISFVTINQVETAIEAAKVNPERYDRNLPGSHGLDILVAGYEVKSRQIEPQLAA